VFCGVLRVFCDVLRVFCDFLRVFCSISTKTHKTPEKYRKTLLETHKKLTIRSCIAGVFQEQNISTVLQKKTFHKTSAKHRKTPQNTTKQSQNAFCEITSQNTAKRTQNARKNVTKRSQYSRNTYCAHSVFSRKIR